jgi:hypothetical protein
MFHKLTISKARCLCNIRKSAFPLHLFLILLGFLCCSSNSFPIADPAWAVEQFSDDKALGNSNLWTADVGECTRNNVFNPECLENGRGNRVQVRTSQISGVS